MILFIRHLSLRFHQEVVPLPAERGPPENLRWRKWFDMRGIYTILLLVCSNFFMTLAWYGHLKLQQMGITSNWPLIGVIALSWSIAFFEYCFQVPANRIGFVDNGGPFSLVQLKVIQEVVSLTVFTIITGFLFQGEGLHWNHAVSFFFLIVAVYFAFK